MAGTNTEPLARPSLLEAAEALRAAAAASDRGDPASDVVQAALRNAVLVVEHELGSPRGGGKGSLESVAALEPRLIPAMERIEAELAELLVLLWQSRRGEGAPKPELKLVSQRLARLADRIQAVLHESTRAVGSGD